MLSEVSGLLRVIDGYFSPGSDHYPFFHQKDLRQIIFTVHESIEIRTKFFSQELENHSEHCNWDEVAGNSRHAYV